MQTMSQAMFIMATTITTTMITTAIITTITTAGRMMALTTDQGQQRLHVHYDACCPSVVVPTQSGSALPHRLSDRIAILRVEPMQGAPPGRLLRPPILAS